MMGTGKLTILFTLIGYVASFNVAPKKNFVTAKFSEQTVKDLNLEEMFEVFEKADSSVVDTKAGGFAGGYLGADGPELKNFDPLKLSKNSPEWVPFFREAELKHGRIAMLATLGFIFTDVVYKLPGAVHDVSSVAAHKVAVESGALAQILLWVSLLEIISIPAVQSLGSRAPGDFAFDPLGLGKPASIGKYQVSELKNGRLAMLAFSGIVTQAALGHDTFPYF